MQIHGAESLADMLGISRETVQAWIDEGLPIAERSPGPPVPHRFDSASVIAWLRERDRLRLHIETPRDRLDRLRGDKVLMEINEKAAQLVRIEDIEPVWAAAVSSAREFLRNQPERLAEILQGTPGVHEMRAILEDAFDDFLTRLSQIDPPADIASAAIATDRAPGLGH